MKTEAQLALIDAIKDNLKVTISTEHIRFSRDVKIIVSLELYGKVISEDFDTVSIPYL